MAGRIFRRPCVRTIRARRHRDNRILALFVIRFGNAENQFIFLNPKLSCFANGQQSWMFVIFGPDPVDNSICLQYVLWAKHFFRVLVLAIGAQNFAGNRLAALFRIAAGRGLHLEQYTLLVRFFFSLNRAA